MITILRTFVRLHQRCTTAWEAALPKGTLTFIGEKKLGLHNSTMQLHLVPPLSLATRHLACNQLYEAYCWYLFRKFSINFRLYTSILILLGITLGLVDIVTVPRRLMLANNVLDNSAGCFGINGHGC